MARPLSLLHDLVLERVRTAGPITARELAHDLQLSVPVVCDYLHRMHQAGRIETVDRLRVPHMKRPALRYRVPVRQADMAPWEALASWPRPGSGAAAGHAAETH